MPNLSIKKLFDYYDCNYSNSRANDLKKHIQAKHTLERHFKCNDCDYAATLLPDLKKKNIFKPSTLLKDHTSVMSVIIRLHNQVL